MIQLTGNRHAGLRQSPRTSSLTNSAAANRRSGAKFAALESMGSETVLLSRIQFALTIGYHILWLKTGRPVYRDLLRFWIHLFALGFAMGVVTGVVISYEVGTNWSGYANK